MNIEFPGNFKGLYSGRFRLRDMFTIGGVKNGLLLLTVVLSSLLHDSNVSSIIEPKKIDLIYNLFM